jgi:hypothetical protein
VLLESVKDHLIPYIVENTYAKDMYDDLLRRHMPRRCMSKDAKFEAPSSNCQDDQ